MIDEIIPEDVKQFILQHIDSVAQLECLLLLQADPQISWSAATIAKELYINEAQAEALLAQLSAQGTLVKIEDNLPILYRYQPKSPEVEHMMVRVVSLYKQYLVPITHLIHSKPKTRVQEFADAFRIRKD